MNEMMNHLGTAIIVLTGSLIAFFMYPHIGTLFVVSPIACAGVMFFLSRIDGRDIDHSAARGLTTEVAPFGGAKTSSSDYTPPFARDPDARTDTFDNKPSLTLGAGAIDQNSSDLKAESPLQVLKDPKLLVFLVIVFLFHTANGTVLPLVMQTLAIGNGGSGILMSGLCIIVAQIFMVGSARICGKYSCIYGRKMLFLIGLASVPVRCLILSGMLILWNEAIQESLFIQILVLSTQILDGVGAGTFGTMYILVTSDISGGTGRFSLMLGMTTAAMSIGGTVSGYLGEALAEDLGYKETFFILAIMSAVPALIYVLFMPETLPEHVKEAAAAEGETTPAVVTSTKQEDEEQHGSHTVTESKAKYIEMY